MNFEFTKECERDISELDNSFKDVIWKKIKRIIDNPYLSKPLLYYSNIRSERLINYRIIFKISENKITFYKVKKRDKAYNL